MAQSRPIAFYLGMAFAIAAMLIPFVRPNTPPKQAAFLFDGGFLAAVGFGTLLVVERSERRRHGA